MPEIALMDADTLAVWLENDKNVPVLTLAKDDFVKTILDKLPPLPNHLTIVERNLSGDFSNINAIDLEADANRRAVS
jgi:hypothetical protein